MILIIVRHGESEANATAYLQGQTPGSLTDKGHEQARQVGLRLRSFELDLIISSDLKRAYDTAGHIAAITGAQLETSARVREWHIGELDGQPRLQFKRAIEELNGPLACFRPPGGESFGELRQRAASFLSDVIQEHKDKTVLLCTHGDFSKMLLGVAMNKTIEEALGVILDNCSVSILNLDDTDQWTIEVLNSTDHLMKKRG